MYNMTKAEYIEKYGKDKYEDHLMKMALYRKEHKDEMTKASQKWKEKNREKWLEYNREYYKNRRK